MTNQKRTELPSPAEQNLIAFRSIGYIPDGTSISYQSGSKEINDISWGLPYQHETGGWVVRVKSNTRRWRSKRWNRNAAINLGWDLENSGYWWQIMNFEGQILDEGFEVTSRKAATISCKKLRNWLKIKRQMEGGGGA